MFLFLKTWLGLRREIPDPDFGLLKFEDRLWRTQTSAGGIPLLFYSGRRVPDVVLREAGLEAIRDLAAMEARARAYLAATAAKSKPWPDLTLAALEVRRPASDWVRHAIAKRDPVAAGTMLRGAPIVSLQFEIAGDRNAVDVILLNGVPVGWDYH